MRDEDVGKDIGTGKAIFFDGKVGDGFVGIRRC